MTRPSDAAEPEPGRTADDRPAFVAVTVGGLRLALPLAAVRAVIRLPVLVPIPLGPPSLDGLAQWHGEAVPVIDLRRALGRAPGESGAAEGERDGNARVVLVGHHGQTIGLRVDGMAGMLRADPDRIDAIHDDQPDHGIDAAMLAGVLRNSATTILDPAALIDRQFGAPDPAATPRHAIGMAAPAGVREAAAGGDHDTVALLVFGAAGQEFALPIDRVREVLPAPATITRMAKAKAHLLGVMSVRDRLLPLVDVGTLFGLDAAGEGEGEGSRRVVVVRAGQDRAPVGVLVDAVHEILRLDRAQIDPVPPLLAREPEFADLDGIARADGAGGNARRLLSVLSADRLFRHGVSLGAEPGTADWRGEGDAMNDSRGGRRAEAVERVVVFRLAGAEYGLPVDAVREVLRRPDAPTPLPNAPDFVAGVLTLRGEVLPLIDQRRLLSLPAGTGGNDRGRVVVVGRAGDADAARIGLIVDGLSGLVAIPVDRIGPAPTVSAAQRRLIGRVATLEAGQGTATRLILLMDPESLLDMDSLTALLVPSA